MASGQPGPSRVRKPKSTENVSPNIKGFLAPATIQLHLSVHTNAQAYLSKIRQHDADYRQRVRSGGNLQNWFATESLLSSEPHIWLNDNSSAHYRRTGSICPSPHHNVIHMPAKTVDLQMISEVFKNTIKVHQLLEHKQVQQISDRLARFEARLASRGEEEAAVPKAYAVKASGHRGPSVETNHRQESISPAPSTSQIDVLNQRVAKYIRNASSEIHLLSTRLNHLSHRINDQEFHTLVLPMHENLGSPCRGVTACSRVHIAWACRVTSFWW